MPLPLVNLDRHTVLEASAGTGKTYQLERLVLRLLTEKRARLDQILLVTYTEKATGELRGRLRTTLEKALAQPSPHGSLLREALDQFEQANICTIHGFCQRVLQEYAFDHREDLRPQLTQDGPLLASCLREIQRRHWREEHGERLRDTLELAGFDRDTAQGWEARVLEAARGFRPACGHVLLPDLDVRPAEKRAELENQIRAVRAEWRTTLELKAGQKLRQHPWAAAFAAYHSGDAQQKRHTVVLLPLLEWLRGGDTGDPALSLQRLLCDATRLKEFADEGFLCLIRHLGKNPAKRLPFHPRLAQLAEAMENLREMLDWPASQSRLAVWTVGKLHHLLDDHKRQRGLMSFEDMLTRMANGLDPDINPAAAHLIRILQQRYRYAIVDEFQDTDPLQWRIFRRLFLGAGTSGAEANRLFVVGDPKQAIFSFRGADLQTYLDAVAEMKERHDADLLPLDENWRSTPELLAALNQLFEQSRWFGDLIPYRRVQAAGERPPVLANDTTGRAALTLVNLGEIERLTDARRQFAHFCAHEIKHLLHNPPALVLKDKSRPLDLGDICILVFKRQEARPVVEYLRQQGIPFTFYKQGGLWQSGEALQIEYVLRALARPGDRTAFHKALLTRFFRARPEELVGGQGSMPANHPARELFHQWLAWADRRHWSALFQSLLEDTGILRYEFLEEVDGERRLANYRHLLASLEQTAYGQNLDLFQLADLLRSKRLKGDDDSDVQPIETQRPKVKIMTIHASKGLEFPVVFLAGGFTGRRNSEILVYRNDEGCVVHDFCPGESARTRHRQEREAEDRRLLYVAMTRPMAKLYVPCGDFKRTDRQSIFVNILVPALKAAKPDALGAPVAEMIDADFSVAGKSKFKSEPAPAPAAVRLDDPAAVFPRLDPFALRQRRIVIRSFSSLHRKLALRAQEAAQFGEQPPRADDDAPDALESPDPLRGPVFGDMVHDVLEQVDFAAIGQARDPQALLAEAGPVRRLIDEQLRLKLVNLRSRLTGTELEGLCRQRIAELVWHALHTPLAQAGGPLWQVPAGDRIAELEFHFPERSDETPPAEVQREEGFLTGFMDLVFRAGGRYFLVDWKTNLLAGYSVAEVAQSVVECDYVRQYRLYLQALARWLRKTQGTAFDFARDFGGVYYLYLRGLNGKDESTGVYFCRPTAADLSLEAVLTESP